MQLNILVGGAAGQGMETVAQLLGRGLVRQGFGVLSQRDYMSRIRGGHNFSRLCLGEKTPWSATPEVHILVALNQETYQLHRGEITQEGRIVYDPGLFSLPEEETRGVDVPLKELAQEAGGAIMSNTVASGAVWALLGLDTAPLADLLQETFGHKPGVAEQNIQALEQGYRHAEKTCSPCFTLPASHPQRKRLFIEGNETLGMSALASGCRFLSAYPMTPSTGVMNYLAGKQGQYPVVVEQAEDEIAAINMVLGASYAGVRSLTCTSGGGFSLMAEGVSLAGMIESPVVVILAMRPGPATGLPTRTAQGDLQMALRGGHGEFPRAVMAASHPEDAFYRLNRAFDLADRYQVPVIFLSDQDYADTARSVDPFDFQRLSYEPHLVDARTLTSPYQRYQVTENGVSPRAVPGQFPGEVVLVDSDEHDANGNIIEDAATRRLMADKRQRKEQGLAAEMEEPELYGAPDSGLLLVAWGSTYGAVRAAVDLLASRGIPAALLHFRDLWPLPCRRLQEIMPRANTSVLVESNGTAQLGSLIREQTGWEFSHQLLKNDGRPFFPGEIVEEVERIV